MPPYAFPKRHREKHITFKELHAVVHAVELFGRGARWEDREIVINTDNTEVAAAVQTGYIKHVASQSLLRRLWLSAAAGRFRISTIWLPSNDNGLADALSRFDWIKAQDIDPIAWRALQRRQSRNLSSLHPLPPQDRSRYFPPRRLVPNPTVAVSNHPRKTSWTLSSSIATRHTTFGSASERELAQPTTRRRRFSKWASGQGFFPFPATTPALCRWAGCMASNGLRPGTVRGSLAGLRFFHTDTGLDDAAFDSTQLGRVLRGIRRDAGALERRLRIPITLPILASILSALRSLAGVSDRDRVALSAAYAVAYVGAFRSGELTYGSGDFDPSFYCSRSDGRDCGDYAVVRLPSSKSDPYRKDVDIIIPSAPPNALVDPLALLRHHLRFNPLGTQLTALCAGRQLSSSLPEELVRRHSAAIDHSRRH